MKVVQCPHCKKPVPWTQESLYRPFCCERCRLIDLGRWADGSYAVPSQEETPDLETDLETPSESSDEDE